MLVCAALRVLRNAAFFVDKFLDRLTIITV